MTMLEKLILPEIRELIRERNLELLCDTLGHLSPADVADLLDDLDSSEDIIAFQCLKPELAARTFEYLQKPEQEELLKILPESELSAILNEIAPDDRTALLEIGRASCRERV